MFELKVEPSSTVTPYPGFAAHYPLYPVPTRATLMGLEFPYLYLSPIILPERVAMLGIWLFVCLLGSLPSSVQSRASEEERVAVWREMYGEWPPQAFLNRENPEYTKMLNDREAEIMQQITGSDERWENWMQHVQGRLVHNFTVMGFKVVDTPPEVHKLLKDAVDKALEDWDAIPEEPPVEAIYHRPGFLPKFIYLGSLASKVHSMMLPYHEAWAGIKLEPTSAYGVRLYRNGSSLTMHVDKSRTHVISSIIHIAHEYDDDNHPWPLKIEGYDGKLHEVNLAPGQMTFYESAKCLHGRPTEFRGKYYASIFVHYQPVERDLWPYTTEDVIQAVPPHWHEGCDHSYGARWAGASITVDSRAAAGAPPRHPNARAARMSADAEL